MNARLLGRLANGNEADSGTLIHRVVRKKAKRPPCPYNDFGRKIIENDDYETDVSICGKKPGRRSVGWDETTQNVTCPTCIQRLTKI